MFYTISSRLCSSLCSLLLCCFCSLSGFAQTDATVRQSASGNEAVPKDTLATDVPYTLTSAGFQPELTGFVPSFQPTAYGIHGYGPYYDGSAGTNWQLHEGFNAQFAMGMTCGFGSNRVKGVGFGQSAAFAYVMPVTSKFHIATGIYASNFDWGPWHTTDVGISGVLAYQLTDRWSVFAFGSKSFIPKQDTFRANSLSVPLYWTRPSSRFGAAAEYKFSEHFKMGFSVERIEY